MADKNDKKDNSKKGGGDQSKQEPAMKKMEEVKSFADSFNTLTVIGAFLAGLWRPSGDQSAGMERQIPGWVLSSMPSLTDEDEIEYNLIIASLTDEHKEVLEKFEEQLKTEGIYDEIKFRVLLVKIRREFFERMKNPIKKNESENLKFEDIKLHDPVLDFVKRLNKEKQAANVTPGEIFEAQKKIAINLKLIEKKHFLKKRLENKTETVFGLIFFLLLIIAVFKKYLS